MKKRTLALLAALVLLLGCVVGGTIAWLTDKTDPVVNTFTFGDINIELDESDNLDLKMVPGNDITKDPVVTVKDKSEDCYLFVKLDKSANYGTYLEEYAIADGWTKLEDGVYYREVAATVEDVEFPVLKDNKVTVKTSVTKADMTAIKDSNQPTLTITAYAVQKANVADAAAAWTIAQG